MANESNALLVVPVSVRPKLSFVDVAEDSEGRARGWVIHRRIKNGRYRWSAKLHVDGRRRGER